MFVCPRYVVDVIGFLFVRVSVNSGGRRRRVVSAVVVIKMCPQCVLIRRWAAAVFGVRSRVPSNV